MAVIQPLYFSGGRYSASVDRKLLAALIQSDSSGNRIEGVIPAAQGTAALKVVHSTGRTLAINSGLCVIADSSTQDVDTPGVFLAGVDTSAETVTIANNTGGSTRYDLVYADVTQGSSIITKKARSGSNVATLTTSSTHGFVTGQTVYISGVDESFDGAYLITNTPTTTTFEYANSGSSVSEVDIEATVQFGETVVNVTNKSLTNNVATLTLSTGLAASGTIPINSLIRVRGVDNTFDGEFHLAAAVSTPWTTITYNINRNPLANVGSVGSPVPVTSSASARARVPFAIKVLQGSTTEEPSLPSGTNIKLARITVPTGSGNLSDSNISDRRQFTTTVGGVHIYDSANTAITPPTFSEGVLRYDTSDKSLEYYDGSAWKLVSNLIVSGTGSATTAAKSDHTHVEFNNHLGISQVSQTARTASGTVTLFPSASDVTTLSASKTYLIEGRLIITAAPTSTSQTVFFDLQPSQTLSSVSEFNFVTWSQTESSSINQSGFHGSDTDADFVVSASISSSTTANLVCKINGIFETTSSAPTITPRIYLSNTTGNITASAGTWLRITELGSDTVTVVNGTWS
jgi:hypothetical protein